MFNGFSTTKRWHFIFAFSSSILVGLFIKYFRTVSIKSYILTSLISQFVIYVSAYCYHKFTMVNSCSYCFNDWIVNFTFKGKKGTHSTYIHLYDFYYRVKYDGELCIKIKFTLKTIKIAQIHFMQILVYIVLNYRGL